MVSGPAAARYALLLAAVVSGGCASLSPTACARGAIEPVDFAGMYDKQAHCIASGLITRRCGARYARLAGTGKEWLDAVGGGDASRQDLRANADGRACALQAATAESTPDETQFRVAISACCRQRWPETAASAASASAD